MVRDPVLWAFLLCCLPDPFYKVAVSAIELHSSYRSHRKKGWEQHKASCNTRHSPYKGPLLSGKKIFSRSFLDNLASGDRTGLESMATPASVKEEKGLA